MRDKNKSLPQPQPKGTHIWQLGGRSDAPEGSNHQTRAYAGYHDHAEGHTLKMRLKAKAVQGRGEKGGGRKEGLHSLDMPVQRASGQRTLGYCPSAEDPAHQSKGKNCTGVE